MFHKLKLLLMNLIVPINPLYDSRLNLIVIVYVGLESRLSFYHKTSSVYFLFGQYSDSALSVFFMPPFGEKGAYSDRTVHLSVRLSVFLSHFAFRSEKCS